MLNSSRGYSSLLGLLMQVVLVVAVIIVVVVATRFISQWIDVKL